MLAWLCTLADQRHVFLGRIEVCDRYIVAEFQEGRLGRWCQGSREAAGWAVPSGRHVDDIPPGAVTRTRQNQSRHAKMEAAGVWRAADLFKDDGIWQPCNVLSCNLYFSIHTHTHLSPCVVYFLLLLFSLSLPFLNLFTSLSVQPDGGVFIFIFSIAKAHMQQQHKYEHRSLIESMRSHSSILSFWIHKPDSLWLTPVFTVLPVLVWYYGRQPGTSLVW